MDLSPEKKEYVANVATEALTRLADIAKAAAQELGAPRTASGDALAYPNATNAITAVENLAKINSAVRESNLHLSREPAIARVVVIDSKEQEHTYYICRTMPVNGVHNLASYRSPVGPYRYRRTPDALPTPFTGT